MKILRLLILFSFTANIHFLFAQDSHISIAVSRDTILLGNAFYVQYSFDSKDGQMITPDIKNAQIIGQNFMSSTSITNGEIRSVHIQKYLIQPTQSGPFTIPGSSIKTSTHESGDLDIPDVTIYVMPNPQHLEIDPEEDSNWQFNEIKPGIGGPKRKSKKL
jgi:BatD DUF11 like domain